MKNLFMLLLCTTALARVSSAQAQRSSTTTARPATSARETPAPTRSARPGFEADRRLALAEPAAATRPARMACAPLGGQVFDPNGKPLVGATLLVKGTQQVYVTNTEGKFQFTAPIYQDQILEVQAAGFKFQQVPLTECTLPRLVLEQVPQAQIRKKGKRAGQVIRMGGSVL